MTTTSNSNRNGALFALCAFALFASHDVVIKFLGASYSPFQIIFFTTLMSFPMTTLMLMRDETEANLRPAHPWWTALRTGCVIIAMTSAFYAFTVLPLAQTYAILFAAPLIITLLAIPILGERVGWRRLLAVLVGLAGVVVVLRPGSTDLHLGHLAALTAAIFSALASVIVRKIGRDERSVVLLLYPLLANFLLMAFLMPNSYQPMPVTHLGAVAVVSLFGFLAGLLMIAAYKNAEAAIVAPMQYSQIVWASIYGVLFFDERIDSITLLGAAIIISSGLFIVFREQAGGTSNNTPVLRSRSRGYGSTFRISPFLPRSRRK
ncbi:MAG: DMT family transporter [Paracoccaceae bacterium]